MQDIENAIKEEFLAEAEEILENCEQAFLDLERSPNDSSIIDAIFRYVHTIKGSGFAAGFDALGNFVHAFEAVLSKVRSNELELDSELMDLFLQATDLTSKFVSALKEDYSALIDTDYVADKLRTYLPESKADEGATTDEQGFGFFDDDDEESEELKSEQSTSTGNPSAIESKTDNKASSTEPGKNTSRWVELIGRKPRIVICDDEPDILELMEMAVDEMELDIVTARHGKEALAKIEENQPDVILTDLKMPELDGLKMVEELQEKGSRAPVIFCSGFADKPELIEFIKKGAFGFVEKPFDSDQIVAVVEKALEFKLLQDAIQQLSVHNFKAYLAVTQMAKYAESGDQEKLGKTKVKMQAELDEISRLTNLVLKPKDEKSESRAVA